jgi:hypothetical protein
MQNKNQKDTKSTKTFYFSLCPLCLCGFLFLNPEESRNLDPDDPSI